MARLVKYKDRTFSFNDDTPDVDIANALQDATRPADAIDVLQAARTNIPANAAATVAGLIQLGIENPLYQGQRAIANALGVGVEDTLKEAKAVTQETKKDVENAAPTNTSFAQDVALSAMSSLPEALAITAAGVGGGATALLARGVDAAAGAGTSLAFGLMGANEAGRTYGDARGEGKGVASAMTKAAVAGGAEVVGEAFSAKPFKDAVTAALQSGKLPGLKSFVAQMLGREIVGEEMTTVIQFINDYLWDDTPMSVGTAAKKLAYDMAVTAGSTAVSGTAQTALYGGALHTIKSAAELGSELKSLRDAKLPVIEQGKPVLDAAVSDVGDASYTQKTTLPEGYAFDEGTGEIIRQDMFDISPAKLPFDQRLELMRQERENIAKERAAAVDNPELALALDAREETFARASQVLAQEIIADPALMRFVAQKDIEQAVIPDVSQQLQVEIAQLLESRKDRWDVITSQAKDAGYALGQSDKELPARGHITDPQLSAALSSTLDSDNIQFGASSALSQAFIPGSKSTHLGMTSDSYQALASRVTTARIDPITGEVSRVSLKDASATLKAGEVQAFSTSEFTPDEQRQAGEIRETLQSLMSTFLPNSKLALLMLPEDDPAYGNAASFISWYDDTLVLPLPRVVSTDTLNVALHEFGHAIHVEEFSKSPTVEKNALVNGYANALEKLLRVDFATGMRLIAAPERARSLIAAVGKGASQKPFYEVYDTIAGTLKNPRYYISFNEYLAEQFVKYFYTRAGVVTEAVPMFKRMLLKMTQLFKATQHLSPDKSYAQWLDNMLLARRAQSTHSPQSFLALRSQLAKEGVHPSILDAMKAPGMEAVDFDTAHVVRAIRNGRPAALVNNTAVFMEAIDSLTAMSDAVSTLSKFRHSTSDRIAAALSARLSRAGAIETAAQVRDLVQHPKITGRKIDPVTLIAFFANKLGNWRVLSQLELPVSKNKVGHIVRVEIGRPGAGEQIKISLTQNRATGEMRRVVADNVENNERLAKLADFVGMQTAAKAGARSYVAPGKEAVEVPYWAHVGKDVSALEDIIPNVAKIRQALGFSQTSTNQMARFNKVIGWSLGAFQLAKINLHIPGVAEMREAYRNRMWYKTQWTKRASATLDGWWNKLPAKERENLARLLTDEAMAADAATSAEDIRAAWRSKKVQDPANPQKFIYILSPDAMKQYHLSEKAAQIYSSVRRDYAEVLDEMEKVALTDLANTYLDPVVAISMRELSRRGVTRDEMYRHLIGLLVPVKETQPELYSSINTQLQDLTAEFGKQREKPYTPYPRFGNLAVSVRDKETKKVVYFETFETASDRAEALAQIRKMFPTGILHQSYIEDLEYSLAGLPRAYIDVLNKQLELSPQQLEKVRELQITLGNANSFLKHMRKRKSIAGFSTDAVRGYADYMRKFANHIARAKSAPEITAAMDLMEQEAVRLSKVNNSDATKLRQLHEWFGKTTAYLNEPGTELGDMKSLVSLWHFGFNISSAVMNSLQVGMATLPYLSQRHGIAQTLRQLKKAYVDLTSWKDFSKLESDLAWGLNRGLETGFLDESLATNIAQIADGGLLTRFSTLHPLRRGIASVNLYAMWAFQKAEEINRRTSFIAAFRLAKEEGMTNEDAFDYARDAVETTQGEYAQENRPPMMRGYMGVVLQFMQYSQNMVFNMFGGDASWKRMLLVQLFLGGLMGLPFAADAAGLYKFLARQWGFDETDIEKQAREHLRQHDVNADLILHGSASSIGGFDLAQRISLGDLVPGMKALASHRKFNDVMNDAAGDIAGPGISLLINAMRFIGEDDPRLLKRLSLIMPSALKNLTRGIQAEIDGGVKDRDGALLYDPTVWQTVGYAAGFLPKELSREYAARSLAFEEATYWTRRRQTLMEEFRYIYLQQGGDGERLDALLDRIVAFNAAAPDPHLRLSSKTLRKSLQSEAESIAMREAGLGTNPMTAAIDEAARNLYH